ncbi:DUF2254 domain-containing protein [Chitinispirillales bacterium ANBcel5]|uniref:DUF2254 domain-containing protein n=1 Tax=Cellulosispirillum alkaliphilum TaxID=3039283 RepID=UPI002A57AD63|nr:DUF2254 domain-containing protein [Chitinispirillales bacterium ANBcel5]
MFARIRDFWFWLQQSPWYIPAFLTVLALFIAVLILSLDFWIIQNEELLYPQILLSASPESARYILSSIASTMITVAGVVFSISVVAVSLASSQFGPKVLPNFMGDKSNQIVLGSFIATFLYCLLILREIPDDVSQALPTIAINTALLAVIINTGFLIYFIHHIHRSVQIDTIIAETAHETETVIKRLYFRNAESGISYNPDIFSWKEIRAKKDGYLQDYDEHSLVHIANKHELILEILPKPGQFILKGNILVKISKTTDEKTQRQITSQIITGTHRLPIKDILYDMDQFVQIATRSLPPVTNDFYTALICLDRLSAAINTIAQTPPPSPFFLDQNGAVRLVVKTFSFGEIVYNAFEPIIRISSDSPEVIIHLIHSLYKIAQQCSRNEYLLILKDIGTRCCQISSTMRADAKDSLSMSCDQLFTFIDSKVITDH